MKFLLLGVVNTLISYCIYLFLLGYSPYLIAFSLSYLFSLVFTFHVNRRYIFKPKKEKSIIVYTLIYILNYIVSVVTLSILINFFFVSEKIAPILTVFIAYPVNYLSMNLFFKK
jgi:putative flippase GtrA